MKHIIILYFATLVVMVPMDGLWIGGIAREFYKSRMGELLEFHLVPAILFYLMYVAGIVVFVNGGDVAKWQSVMLYGAFFGFVAYATYDLTNMATLRGWPLSLVIVDIAWGAFTTSIAATGGWFIAGFFER
jgi:uncharacterized membrane protein